MKDRFGPVSTASNYLVLSTFLVLMIQLYRADQLNLGSIAVVGGICAAANLLFLATSLFVFSLYPGGKLRFPANLTLPVIFLGFLALFAATTFRVGTAVELPPEPIRFLGSILSLKVYGFLLVLHVALLTLQARRSAPEEPIA